MALHLIPFFHSVAALFQTPVVPAATSSCKNPSNSVSASFACASPRPQQQQQQQTSTTMFGVNSQQGTTTVTPVPYVASNVALTPLPCRSASPVNAVANVATPVTTSSFRHSPSPNAPISYSASHSPGVLQVRCIFGEIFLFFFVKPSESIRFDNYNDSALTKKIKLFLPCRIIY